MLLSEQLRSLQDEEVLVANPSSYTTTSGPDWATLRTENITLAAQKIVWVRFRGAFQAGDSAFLANSRVTLGGVPLMATGKIANGESFEREIYVILSAGSYSFAFQACILGSAGTVRIDNIRIGACNFPDKSESIWDSGNVSCPTGQTTTVLEQQFTMPSTRKLVAGSLKQCSYFITVYIVGGKRKSCPRNVGEGSQSGWFNWRVYLDGTEKGWNEDNDDNSTTDPNPDYGKGAHGKVYGVFNVGSTHTLRIDCNNQYGQTLDCRVYVRVILCPWILTIVDSNILDLDFPQGSTLYVMLEPLSSNPIKSAKIGKDRIVDLSANYYASVSGQGIITLSYTFEIVDVLGALLVVSGHHTCMSYLAVDVR